MIHTIFKRLNRSHLPRFHPLSRRLICRCKLSPLVADGNLMRERLEGRGFSFYRISALEGCRHGFPVPCPTHSLCILCRYILPHDRTIIVCMNFHLHSPPCTLIFFVIFIVSSQKILRKQPPSLAKRRGLLSAGCHFACFCSRIVCSQLLFAYQALLLFSYQTLPTMNHRRFFALASSLALWARPMRRAQSRRTK